MPGGPAAKKDHPLHALEERGRKPFLKRHGKFLWIDPARQGPLDGLRLLMNFLKHIMRKPALLG